LPVKKAGMMLLGLPENGFGSQDFRSDTEKLASEMSLNIMSGGGADPAKTKMVPDDRMVEPLLLAMWYSYHATKVVFGIVSFDVFSKETMEHWIHSWSPIGRMCADSHTPTAVVSARHGPG